MVFKVGASWAGYSFSFSAILIWGQLFTIVLWSVVQHATCAVDLYRIKGPHAISAVLNAGIQWRSDRCLSGCCCRPTEQL